MNEQMIVTLKVDELKSIIDESVANALAKVSQKPDTDSLLNRKDVARLFGISLVTLNQWMRDGRIQYYRINSRIFFKHHEVLQALISVKKYDRK